VPLNEKSRCEKLIEDAKAALNDENTTAERFKQLNSDIQQALHMIAASAYQQSTSQQQGGGAEAGDHKASGSDDVIDAEFRER